MYFSTYFLKIELKKSDQTCIFSLYATSAPMLCFQKKMANKEVQLTAFASGLVLRFLGVIIFQNLSLFVLFLKLSLQPWNFDISSIFYAPKTSNVSISCYSFSRIYVCCRQRIVDKLTGHHILCNSKFHNLSPVCKL